MISVASLIALSCYPAALIIAAFNDLYEFKIPNWVSTLLVVSFFAGAVFLLPTPTAVFESLMLSIGALIVGFILFARNIIGGGDAKLFSATTLWVGFPGFAAFLLNMALAGAFLALFLLIFRKTPALPIYAHAPWLLRLHQRPRDIPYAVAICVGGLLSFQETLYFQLMFGG